MSQDEFGKTIPDAPLGIATSEEVAHMARIMDAANGHSDALVAPPVEVPERQPDRASPVVDMQKLRDAVTNVGMDELRFEDFVSVDEGRVSAVETLPDGTSLDQPVSPTLVEFEGDALVAFEGSTPMSHVSDDAEMIANRLERIAYVIQETNDQIAKVKYLGFVLVVILALILAKPH